MKLSSNEEFGLRCMVRLAYANQGLTIPEMSQAEGVLTRVYGEKAFCAYCARAVS